jgi:hypothetical protein
MVLPIGSTGNRPSGAINGEARYNSTTSRFEGYQNNSWASFGSGDGTVTSVDVSGGATGLTTTGGPVTGSGTITLVGTPISATNIAGGAANKIPYQASPSNTSFVDAPVSADTFLKWDGAAFAWDTVAGAGTVTSVSGAGTVNGITLTGTVTSSGNLTLGGALSGVSLATQVTGTLPVLNGGTGATDAATARSNLSAAASGANTDITSVALTTGTISTTPSANTDIANKLYVDNAAATGVASFSAGTTGLTPNSATTGAVTLAGTLAVANGGTGQTTAGAAFNALSPITTAGDLILGNGANSATRLGIGANGYLLTSNGTTASWAAAGGVTTFAGGTTGLTPATATSGAISLSGTLVVGNGGTGATTLTGYVKGAGTTALTASATIPNTDITGLGSMSTQNANSVAVTGGAIDGTTVGATTASTVKATTVTTSGTGSPTDGAGQVYLNGATSNRVEWSTAGTGAPAFTTRSAGTKLLLYPSLSGSVADYAIGIDAATMWSSVPENNGSFKFKWYGAITEIASLDGTGAFTAVGGISGGTFS